MAKMKQLDEMAEKLVPQILHKIYNTINTEIAYSDLDLEGDQVSDAHDYVMVKLKDLLTIIQVRYLVMVVTMKVVMVKKVNVMSATKSIKLLILIALLSYSCYKFGQGSPIIVEKTVEVKVYDAGFCASCYKEHTWDNMYVMMNTYQDSIHNTNEVR